MRFLIPLCFLLLASCDSKPTPTANRASQPIALLTERVQWQPQQTLLEAVGTSRARQSVVIHAEVSGEIDAIRFQTGDKVTAGQVLIELDARDQKLAVELAKVELEEAQRLYQRYQRSKGAGAVTESTLDEARSAVERARIALARAEVDLSYRTIRAPFDGHVGLMELDIGARIEPSTPLVSLDDRSELLVRFPIPELFLGQLVPDQWIEFNTWVGGAQPIRGKILDIDSRIDAQTRSFTVRASVPNTEDRLRPGASFRVQVHLSGGIYPTIPEIALQWGGDGAFVWAIQDGKAKRVSATIVQRTQGQILVDADLPEGTEVVTEGVQRVREGQQVRTLEQRVGEATP